MDWKGLMMYNNMFNQFNGGNPYPYTGAYQQGYSTVNQTNNTLPHYELLTGDGRRGAEAIQMGPNSKALIVDNLAPRVWLVTTDGCGAKTIKPFKLLEEDEETGFTKNDYDDIKTLTERLEKLEAKVYGKKSYSGGYKPKHKSKYNSDNKSITESNNNDSTI